MFWLILKMKKHLFSALLFPKGRHLGRSQFDVVSLQHAWPFLEKTELGF